MSQPGRWFKTLATTPAPKKRTMWANCVEFVHSVKDYFRAKRVNKEFQSNYQRVVAATALNMLRQQRSDRKEMQEKFAAMTDAIGASMTGLTEQAEKATNTDAMKQQLDLFEKQLNEDLKKHENYLEELRKRDLEARLTRTTSKQSLQMPIEVKKVKVEKDVFERDFTPSKRKLEDKDE